MWIIGTIIFLLSLFYYAPSGNTSLIVDALINYDPLGFLRGFSYLGLVFFIPLLAIPIEPIASLISRRKQATTGIKRFRVSKGGFLLLLILAFATSLADATNTISSTIGLKESLLVFTVANFFYWWTAANTYVNIKYIFRPRESDRGEPIGYPYPEFGFSDSNSRNVSHRPLAVWDASILSTMGSREFEELVARVFKTQGFITELTSGGGDGGVDVYAYIHSEKVVISCKRYKDIVAPMYVRDIHSVAVTQKASKGFLVTSGRFSNEIRKQARLMSPRIYLIDGDQLADLLNGEEGVSVYG